MKTDKVFHICITTRQVRGPIEEDRVSLFFYWRCLMLQESVGVDDVNRAGEEVSSSSYLEFLVALAQSTAFIHLGRPLMSRRSDGPQ